MASLGSKNIDEINDISDMCELLKTLGIYRKGPQTMDGMKRAAKEFLSKDKCAHPKVQASTILLDARDENARKREELQGLFSTAYDLLHHIKIHSRLLPQNWRGTLWTVTSQIEQLKEKNVHILVAGETSAGKSSLINLILGERVLPSDLLPSTSTICEMKYGEQHKIVLHLKEADSTNQKRKVVSLKEFREEVRGAKEGKGSIYEKIEFYQPHQLLKEGIVIVDSPGIGEEESMNEMVTQYLTKAFAFVYVIDTSHGGGVQKDRIETLMNHTMTKVFEKGSEKKGPSQESQITPLEHEFQSKCALFLCNKWDLVLANEDANPDEVKENVIMKLKKCWPGLVPEDQVFFMSIKKVKLAVEYGGGSDDFEKFMNSMKSMILKGFEIRLEIHWRWLYRFLSWISYKATNFLVNTSSERNKAQQKMQVIRHRLDVLKEQQSRHLIDLRRRMDNTVLDAVQKLMAYLESDSVRERFSDWTQDEVPTTFDGKVNQKFQKRLKGFIDEWEEDKFKNAKESLVQQIQHHFNSFENQLSSLRGHVTGDFLGVPSIDPFPGGVSFLSRLYVKISWVFHNLVFPFSGSKPGYLPSDSKVSWREIERNYKWFSDPRDAMKKLSEEYLRSAVKESVLKPYVKSRLKEAEQCLSLVETLIPEKIEADKKLLAELSSEQRSSEEIKGIYLPIRNDASSMREKLAVFGLRKASAAKICSKRLDWNQGSYYLGAGEFSSVYRGKMMKHGGEQAVALKVFKEVPLDKIASRVIQEADQLSKLDHPHFVEFYGTAIVNENDAVKAVLVMELCKGNLKSHFESHLTSVPGRSGRRDHVLQAFKWVIEICSALDYIHNESVVHRDLMLQKILLSEDNTVKLYDVSVGKEVDSITGKFKGTPPYMAPEVFRSELNDFKADIYSLGIMLWEIWFGPGAFADIDFDLSDPQDFFNLVGKGSRPKDVENLKKPPLLWKELMEECWDGDPEKRPTAKKCEQVVTKLSNEWSG